MRGADLCERVGVGASHVREESDCFGARDTRVRSHARTRVLCENAGSPLHC